MSNGREERNIIMFPFMAHAHLNPFMHGTCNRIGTKGGLHTYTITIVNTPLNIQTLKSSLSSKTNIRFAEIPFHGTTHGLPPHVENTDILSHEFMSRFLKASENLGISLQKPPLRHYQTWQSCPDVYHLKYVLGMDGQSCQWAWNFSHSIHYWGWLQHGHIFTNGTNSWWLFR